jgi:methylthioribulose 1-phosphate dehydratase / enolase-phosphatase E1
MIKGIEGHGYYDELVVPIIENTAWEHELADSLGDAIAKYPKSPAVLVRQHGMYVWGKTWEAAKRHSECLHYLFDALIEAHKLNVNHLITVPRPVTNSYRNYKHILLDIEGTLSPISFVKEILFPYSAAKVKQFLADNYENAKVAVLVRSLAEQAQQDAQSNNVVPVVQSTQSPVLEEVEAYIQYLIASDRKLTAWKTMQGMIWESGYRSEEIVATVFDDIRRNFERLTRQENLKISIYSSGSRFAQHLFFAHSNAGDLRPFLSAYFDTTIGLKGESKSYEEIALTLGTNNHEILFVTDILAEAQAAEAAGFEAFIASRPGNAVIAEAHDFKVIQSFDEL